MTAETAEAIRQKAEALRYRRPALSLMGYHTVMSFLEDLQGTCDDIRWAADDKEIIEHFADDGGEDELSWRMDFCDMSAQAEALYTELYGIDPDTFDDCTVSLIGNRYSLVGYDTYEEDYFSLCSWQSDRAQTDSGKRLMRMTKAEMLSTIGQCVGALLAFYDLRQKFDCIQAALGVALDHNLDTLRTVRGIDEAYEAWDADGREKYGEKVRRLDGLLDALPDICWIA